jgi:hypothetical protein
MVPRHEALRPRLLCDLWARVVRCPANWLDVYLRVSLYGRCTMDGTPSTFALRCAELLA